MTSDARSNSMCGPIPRRNRAFVAKAVISLALVLAGSSSPAFAAESEAAKRSPGSPWDGDKCHLPGPPKIAVDWPLIAGDDRDGAWRHCPTGPTGPTGPTVAAGLDGATGPTGPTGPTGAAATITGTQVVSTTSPVPPLTSVGNTVLCPANTTVTGGGGYMVNGTPTSVAIHRSRPNGKGWEAAGWSTIPNTLIVYAVCLPT